MLGQKLFFLQFYKICYIRQVLKTLFCDFLELAVEFKIPKLRAFKHRIFEVSIRVKNQCRLKNLGRVT